LKPGSLVSIFYMHLRVAGDDRTYSIQDSCSNIFGESGITNNVIIMIILLRRWATRSSVHSQLHTAIFNIHS